MKSVCLVVCLIALCTDSLAQSCDCPPPATCGACSGGITSLTLRFNGSAASTIEASDQLGVVFSAVVNPGDEFTFIGSLPNDKFVGPNVEVTVDGILDATIGTNCGQVTFPDIVGSFTIAGAMSKDGGSLCCSAGSEDTTLPVINDCPLDIALGLPPTDCSMPVVWTPPTASDNCAIESLTSTHNPGDLFTVGTTTVEYTATDPYGNIATCSFEVTITDTTVPVITGCPGNINLSADASCQAVATWTAPLTTDNCSATIAGTHNPGDAFVVGTTTVTYTATDVNGNTSSCSFDVIVTDTTVPVITGCPGNIIMSVDASCQAIATWTAPLTTDNCSSTIAGTHNSGDAFVVGTTTVTYTATDVNGNIATCSFDVIVTDTMVPVITGCPGNINLTVDASCQAIATWTAPLTTDNCSVTIAGTHNSGDAFAVGTTTVTYTATDVNGNSSICTFDVIVTDTTVPVITGCPGNINLTVDASCQAIATWPAPLTTDNCSATIAGTHTSGDAFLVGTTTVTYTATDVNGNISTCSFDVTVTDTTVPVITGCPGNISLNAGASCQAIATWAVPTTSDNCSATITGTHNTGDPFAVGTTTVIYTATDVNGNTATCTFDVVVTDTTVPVITGCPGNISLNAGASCQAIATWTAPLTSDECSSTITGTHNSGDAFAIGTTTVTYTATDPYGNVSTCSFDVVVSDSAPPVFANVPADLNIEASGSCAGIASWSPPTATDDCPLILTSTHVPGETFPFGTTTVTYTATDENGNVSTHTFDVVVVDTSAPVFSGCPANMTLQPGSSCSAAAVWTPPTTSDACAVVLSSTHASGAIFSMGTTTVSYTATDLAGNSSTCTFTVTVADTEAPVLGNCPADITVQPVSNCSATVSWSPPQVTDDCTFTVVSTHLPGDVFLHGTTSVTYTATDASGNVAVCSFDVVVNDTSPPVIAGCPTTVTATATGSCSSTVSWTAPVFTDGCQFTVSSSHSPGALFPVGSTAVTYTATDQWGNAAVCSFNVVVTDASFPGITGCPADITVTAPEGCNAIVTWSTPGIVDNCSAVLTVSHAPGSAFPLGSTTVVYTATDPSGNASQCQFNVFVRTATPPELTSCPEDIKLRTIGEGAEATWIVPDAIAQCGEVTTSASHEPGELFAVGTTDVIYEFSDESGNTSMCTFKITVELQSILVDVPKVITPDGDGHHDTWQLNNIEQFGENSVHIVDRWGNQVYHAIGYNNQNVLWDGVSINGSRVPTGTYFYALELRVNKKLVRQTGFVEVIQ